jgi:hypothetical protein
MTLRAAVRSPAGSPRPKMGRKQKRPPVICIGGSLDHDGVTGGRAVRYQLRTQ